MNTPHRSLNGDPPIGKALCLDPQAGRLSFVFQLPIRLEGWGQRGFLKNDRFLEEFLLRQACSILTLAIRKCLQGGRVICPNC